MNYPEIPNRRHYELPPVPGQLSTKQIIIRLLVYVMMASFSLGVIYIFALSVVGFIGYVGQ
jgi:hypothetical protein